MSFWGLSKSGKEAQGRSRELGAWNFDQFKNNLTRDGSEYDFANAARALPRGYYEQLMAGGFGDPSQARGMGEQIMPVDNVLGSRRNRLNRISDMAGEMTPGAGTMDLISSNIDAFGEASNRLGDTQGGLIDSSYGRMNTGRERAHNDIVGNIQDNYGSVRDATGAAYGGLRADNSGTMSGLRSSSGDAYGTAQSGVRSATAGLDSLKPAGEFAAARASRAFQPAQADVMRRLRSSGINPNSPQAAAQLARIGSMRGRAMDDAFAGDANSFADRQERMLDRSTGLTLDRQGAQERLELSRLGNERDLAREGAGIDRDVMMRAGDDFRTQLRDNAAQERDLNLDWREQQMGNNERGFGRTADYYNQRNNQAMTARGLEREDFGLNADLAREQNNEDLLGLDLRNQQFERGTDWMNRNQQSRAAGAGGLDQQAQGAFGNSRGYGNMAGQFSDAASQNYNTTYQREAANAGWGTKLIGGVAGAAANYFAPGSGQLVSGAFGGNNGGGGGGFTGGGGYSGGSFGGFGTPPFNPNIQQQPRNYQRGVNPGQMMQDGSFRLTR